MELINQIDKTFLFDKKEIRIIGTCDEPWFAAVDICNVLGLKNVTVSLKNIPDKWRDLKMLVTPFGNQNMIIINESALYKLIMRSNKQITEKFQEFVCEEILPSIRKTGEFNLQKQLQEKDSKIKDMQDKLDKKIGQIKRRNNKKGEMIYMGTNELDKEFFKVGITCNANSRISGLSTGTTTDFVMKNKWYTNFNKEIEDAVKKNFEEERYSMRKELYTLESYNDIHDYIDILVKVFNDNDRHPQIEKIPPPSIKRIKNPLCLPEKPCTVCNIVQQLENFYKAEENTDKRENRCKKCVKKLQEEYIEIKRKTETLPTEKICTECNEICDLDDFYKDNQKFDKKSTKCKICFKKIQDKEKVKIDIKEYCCATCKIVKPIDDFHKLARSKTGHKYNCKLCVLIKAKSQYNNKKHFI